MSLLRKIWGREDGTGAETPCERISFMPKESTMAIRVQNVLRCNLHGIQHATNCNRDVLFIPHDCSNRFVLSHHVVTICEHLWS